MVSKDGVIYLEIGRIASVHGLKGSVNVDLWCDGAGFASQFKTLYFLDSVATPVKVASCRAKKTQCVFSFSDTTTLEQAEKIVGKMLYFNKSDAVLEDGRYFECDLLGLEVVESATGKTLGKLCNILRTGANDVYEFADESGAKKLFPAIPQVVDKVDLGDRKIYITPLSGLFD